MKAVISNRIYIQTTNKDYVERLASDLTYRIPPRVKGQFPTIIKNFNRISPVLVSIPGERHDLIPEGYEIIDKRIDTRVEFPKFKFDLRDSQREVYDNVDSSCIINAAPSWGKFCPLIK